MSKKTKVKLDKQFIKMLEQEESERIAATKNFCDANGTWVDFTYSSGQDPLAPFRALAKVSPAPQALTQDQLRERCKQIRDNIKLGVPGNIEVQLNKGRQMYGQAYGQTSFLLGNMVVKILPMDVGKPEYLFIKDGDTLDTSIFLGGEYGSGIMLITDERGDDYFLRLSEFHLISIEAESNSPEKVALMTSFIRFTAKVYTSVFRAADFYPIISLLLSDWIQEEWKRAKDAATESSNKEIGGDINEQK